MLLPALPLAWLQEIGPLLVVAFWVIRQVMIAIGEQKEQEAAKNAPPIRDQAELPPKQVVEPGRGRQADDPWGDAAKADFDQKQAREQAKPPAQQGDLRSEVDDFLKRVAQARDEAAGQQEARVGPTPEQIARRRQLDPFEEPPRRVARKPKPKPKSEPKPKVEPLPRREEQSTAQSHKTELRHLPESQLAENAAHLGEGISQADDRVEARLQQKFDHKLGKLRREPEAIVLDVDETAQTGAQRIKALLARPGGVREAVVLSEILRRPID